MLMLIAAWASCSMLLVWALFVAGRLRSVWWSKVALLLGLAPMAMLLAGRLPVPHVDVVDLVSLGGAGVALVALWGVAVYWARQPADAPMVDASRMRWTPRASHRPTWVIAVGLSTLLTLALVLMDRSLVGVLPWVVMAVAHGWAHQGERGPMRVEARDVVLGRRRIAIDELAPVRREVRFLGPVRRERLVVQDGAGCLYWLVTGSPTEHVLAVEHLLSQQQAIAATREVAREPVRLPPEWLVDLHERGGRQMALRSDGEAT